MGERIAQLRKRCTLSQQELASQLGISPSAVGMYEQGRREPDAGKLAELAEIFGVSVDYLVTGQALSAGGQTLVQDLWPVAAEKLDGTLTLRHSDGTESPFGAAELAVLLAALTG